MPGVTKIPQFQYDNADDIIFKDMAIHSEVNTDMKSSNDIPLRKMLQHRKERDRAVHQNIISQYFSTQKRQNSTFFKMSLKPT